MLRQSLQGYPLSQQVEGRPFVPSPDSTPRAGVSLQLNCTAPLSKNGGIPAQHNSASVSEDDAGATGAASNNHDEQPSSVLPRTPIPSDGKKLFFEFLSRYLGVTVFGIQPGWANRHPDCYLFVGPYDTTMTVPTSVMLLDQDVARRVIEEKVSAKRKAFEKGQP